MPKKKAKKKKDKSGGDKQSKAAAAEQKKEAVLEQFNSVVEEHRSRETLPGVSAVQVNEAPIAELHRLWKEWKPETGWKAWKRFAEKERNARDGVYSNAIRIVRAAVETYEGGE